MLGVIPLLYTCVYVMPHYERFSIIMTTLLFIGDVVLLTFCCLIVITLYKRLRFWRDEENLKMVELQRTPVGYQRIVELIIIDEDRRSLGSSRSFKYDASISDNTGSYTSEPRHDEGNAGLGSVAALGQENVTHGPNQENAIAGPSQENTIAGPSQENAIAGPSKENAIAGPSQENAIAGPSQENPTAGSSQENAIAGPSQENAIAGPSQENAVAGPRQENAIAGPSQENVVAGPSQENATAEPSQENAVAGPSQENAVAGPSQENAVAGPHLAIDTPEGSIADSDSDQSGPSTFFAGKAKCVELRTYQETGRFPSTSSSDATRTSNDSGLSDV